MDGHIILFLLVFLTIVFPQDFIIDDFSYYLQIHLDFKKERGISFIPHSFKKGDCLNINPFTGSLQLRHGKDNYSLIRLFSQV